MIEYHGFVTPCWLLSEAEDRQQGFVIILATGEQACDTRHVQQFLNQKNIRIDSLAYINKRIAEIYLTLTTQQAWSLFRQWLSSLDGIDIAVMPVAMRKKKLLLCDMDNTIVSSETLDDIASATGRGEQIKALTERAMRGVLDFRQALDERVSLLKGISDNIMDEIADKVSFNPGAEMLINRAGCVGMETVLVTGGFEPIAKQVANKLGFDRYVCNRVESRDKKLTGKILEPVVDGETKLNVLKQECERLAIKPHDVCCIGDGANDLSMLQAAGLGIGFRAKPLIREAIAYQINSSGLDTALAMMGIAPED